LFVITRHSFALFQTSSSFVVTHHSALLSSISTTSSCNLKQAIANSPFRSYRIMKQLMAIRGGAAQLGLALAVVVLVSAWSPPVSANELKPVEQDSDEDVSETFEDVGVGRGHALVKRNYHTDYDEDEKTDDKPKQKPVKKTGSKKHQGFGVVQERSAYMEGGGGGMLEGYSKLQIAAFGFAGYICFAMFVLGIFAMLDKMGFPIRREDDDEGSSYRSRGASTI